MVWTTLVESLLLTRAWQFAPASLLETYRLVVLNPLEAGGNAGAGRFEIGQFDTDGDAYGLRSFRTESFGLIVQCKKPTLFDSQRLGLRVPTGFSSFSIKVEVNEMPLFEESQRTDISAVSSTTPTVTGTASKILVANPLRKGFSILNRSGYILSIDFDGDVTAASYATRINNNALYESPVNFKGDVWGILPLATSGVIEVREYI